MTELAMVFMLLSAWCTGSTMCEIYAPGSLMDNVYVIKQRVECGKKYTVDLSGDQLQVVNIEGSC